MARRNSLCPCNSGRKFKACCGRTINSVNVEPPGARYARSILDSPQSPLKLGPSITVECLCVFSFLPKYGPDDVYRLVTLTAAGPNDASVSYSSAQPLSHSSKSPFFRLGFADNELRPHCEFVLTDGNIQYFKAKDALVPSEKPLQIAVTLDSIKKRAELWIDGNLDAHATLAGTPIICDANTVSCGDGGFYRPFYTRYWRRVLTRDTINSVRGKKAHGDDWFNIFHSPTDPYTIYIGNPASPVGCMSTHRFARMPSNNEQAVLAKRVLRLEGLVSDSLSDTEAIQQATVSIKSLRESLSALIASSDTKEPDLLAFMKDNPSAIMFFEPMAVAQWREAAIQNHGQIDFLIKLAGGRYAAVEIECKSAQIFRANHEFTQHTNHAIDQTKTWMRGCRKHPALTLETYSIGSADLVDGYVVLGRAAEVHDSQARKDRWNEQGKSDVPLKTWDDILNQALTLERFLVSDEIRLRDWSERAR